jgi:hypothetical protein
MLSWGVDWHLWKLRSSSEGSSSLIQSDVRIDWPACRTERRAWYEWVFRLSTFQKFPGSWSHSSSLRPETGVDISRKHIMRDVQTIENLRGIFTGTSFQFWNTDGYHKVLFLLRGHGTLILILSGRFTNASQVARRACGLLFLNQLDAIMQIMIQITSALAFIRGFHGI